MNIFKQLAVVYTLLMIFLIVLIGIYFFVDTDVKKPQIITYHLEAERPKTIIMETSTTFNRERLLEVNAIEDENAELERCVQKLSRRWDRTINHEHIVGYDEDLDRLWVQDLKIRLSTGEKIC